MQLNELKQVVIDALEDLKAINIKIIDVSRYATFTDLMIIASGSSTRQVKAIADKVVGRCKESGVRPLGIEGEREAEWILVDVGDIVVHVMLPQTRDFYNLEKLWTLDVQLSSETAASQL
jgi:ribosome-associated protein